MASKLNILNMALLKVGVSPVNTTLSNDPVVVSMNEVYDLLKESLLAEGYWDFAIKRVTLALSLESVNDGEWAYKHVLPTDMVTIKDVYGETEYEIENGFLLSDSSTVKIEYVYNLTDETKFSASFAKVLAYDLALAVGARFIMTGDQKRTLMSEREQAFNAAKLSDMKQHAVITDKWTDHWSTNFSNPYGEE